MAHAAEFNCKAWLDALHRSFCESIAVTMRDFREELASDGSFDAPGLEAGLQAMETKMMMSVQVNIDKLEHFYTKNSIPGDGQYSELLHNLESRSANDSNYQERVDAVFREIQQSCVEFADKKQQYLKYCLYDKYLDKERALTQTNEEVGQYFDMRVREEQIHARARQDKEFLKDFGAYVDMFGNMQTDLLRKLQ